MALQHLRSSTANKRPVPSGMSDGQLAINSNLASPGLFLKDSNGDLVKVGPVHIGTTAPNVSPASGGQAGNSKGEQWLDTASSRYVFKVWDGTAWRTQDGEFVNVTGDTMTGALVMDNQQQVQFRETTANGTNYVALQATASVVSDKIITLPDITGTVVTTGDTGSVTSTMILNGTIVDADINASAAIVDTKLATIATAGKVSNSATTATSSGTASTIVARDGSGNFAAGTITATLAGNASTVTTNANLAGDVTSSGNATSIANGVIVNDDVNASAAIAGSKISPNFGSQTVQTTGIFSAAAGTAAAPSVAFTGDIDTGLYSPGVNQAAVATNGIERVKFGASEVVFNDGGANYDFRIEGDTNASLFFVDASAESIGIGTTSPSAMLSISGSPSIITLDVLGQVRESTDVNWNYSGLYLKRTLSNVAIAKQIAFLLDGDSEVSTTLTNNLNIWGTYSGAPTSGSTSTGLNASFNIGAPNQFIVHTNGSQRAAIDSSGRLLVGTSTSVNTKYDGSVFAAEVQLAGTAVTAVSLARYGANGDGSAFVFNKSRGSLNVQGAVDANDTLGYIGFTGSDGANLQTAATIRVQVDGTPGTNDMPGRLVFSTTSDGASSPTERMRITSTGAVTISTGDLTVYGVTVGRGAGAIVNNTAVGNGALLANTTGGNNTANGFQALAANTTGGNNTANGLQALAANTTGINNTANGYQALLANTTGINNIANGFQALAANTTGASNVANGYQALLATTSGTTNTAIGNSAGSTNTTGANNSFIGNGSQGASATASNVITLGNASIATLRCQVTTITSLSDARDKTNIVTIPAGLDFINALRPVAFDWNTRDGQKVGIHEFGFIAQELQEAQESTGITVPNLVSIENPEKLEASAGTLLPVLVSAVQELTTMVKDLQEEIATLKAE